MTQAPDHDLPSLSRCLARPVRRGWLSLALAEAVILMAALRTQRMGAEAVANTAQAQAELRRAAAA